MEDDTYEGYHIPKDAIVMSNVWAVTRDGGAMGRPEDYVPERFLGAH